MAHDLVIRNAKICDGLGRPAYHASVAIEQGKLVEIGESIGRGNREIDADGLVLAPGFIDIHTHYDAQVCWDPLLTSSPWHGVTTVLMGNCGVGVAPCRPSDRSVLAWDLVNVEAVPYDLLMNAVAWDWESFPDYLNYVRRRGIAINGAFLVPLSALRSYVMGEAASERAATTDEIQRIVQIFRAAMAGGAYGFSITTSSKHIGYQARPVSCRLASKEELGALCTVMRELGKGIIEFNVGRESGRIPEDKVDLMCFVARESQRPVTWDGIFDIPGMPPGANDDVLARLRPLREQGLRIIPQVKPRPVQVRHVMHTPNIFSEFPSWKPAFNRSREEQLELYASPDFRKQFKSELDARRGAFFNGEWNLVFVAGVHNSQNRRFLNKTIEQIGEIEHKHPVDALLDLAVSENLELELISQTVNQNPITMRKLITSPELIYGLSDGGAHINETCGSGQTSYVLHEWVLNRQVLSLEQAVMRLSTEQADLMGLKNKGRIVPGADADLVLFDPATVNTRPVERVADLPGGKQRLIERAEGIAYTIVAGQVVFDHDQYQEVLPGQVLSGMSTQN